MCPKSFDQSRHPLDEASYHKVYDDILQQLMETDEYDKLRVWSSEVEKRDVFLTAKKTSPSWKKVIMRKTVHVDNDKVIQSKYIGDKGWGDLTEIIANGPLRVRTYMVFLKLRAIWILLWTTS